MQKRMKFFSFLLPSYLPLQLLISSLDQEVTEYSHSVLHTCLFSSPSSVLLNFFQLTCILLKRLIFTRFPPTSSSFSHLCLTCFPSETFSLFFLSAQSRIQRLTEIKTWLVLLSPCVQQYGCANQFSFLFGFIS